MRTETATKYAGTCVEIPARDTVRVAYRDRNPPLPDASYHPKAENPGFDPAYQQHKHQIRQRNLRHPRVRFQTSRDKPDRSETIPATFPDARAPLESIGKDDAKVRSRNRHPKS